MSEEPRAAAPAPEAEPLLPSAADEAELVIRRGSAGRWLLRALVAAALLGAAVVGGYLGYRALLEQRVRQAPMVRFDAGTARIGNDAWPEESPAHDVALAAFSIDLTEVTVLAYRVCVDAGGCAPPRKGDACTYFDADRDEHPVNCVTFEQAEAFCRWANKRLPTEKEWERAARPQPPAEGLFPWGADPPSASLANYAADDGHPLTAPVASFPKGATKEGLYDMAGNVWEWTKSPYCTYPEEACGHEAELVIRGGGFRSNQPRTLEATSREALGRQEATETVGFRCARDG